MQKKHFKFAGVLLLTISIVALVSGAQASSYDVLYSFGTHPDAQGPQAGLVFDSSGNLFGTTFVGGAHGFGAVYELSPVQGGGWSERVIYSFTGGADGGNPASTLVVDGNGNLYGTAFSGGAGGGVAFELSASGGVSILHTFAGGTDGSGPLGGLIADGFGDLIGTTISGGAKNFGTVFQLTPNSGGWSESTIHSFTAGHDQANPRGKLTMDRRGRIYGTTSGLNGSVYWLTRGRGMWHYRQLFCFCDGGGGETPYGGVAIDRNFHIFGTTYTSPTGLGEVFELIPGRPPVLNSIYPFTGKADGSNPEGGVVLDSSGKIWGTTSFGGSFGVGVVFSLAVVNGAWTEIPVHTFGGHANSDGATPITDLIFDASGNLYGTTLNGGANGAGTVFEVIP